MQIFIPYPTPLGCAQTLWNDQKRFNKQIIEAQQILDAINNKKTAWKNHPVTLMYKNHPGWLEFYLLTFQFYSKSQKEKDETIKLKNKQLCEIYSNLANTLKPKFINDDLCNQHKRRLFTKAPNLYPQFQSEGISEENWYFINGKIIKYVKGKKI